MKSLLIVLGFFFVVVAVVLLFANATHFIPLELNTAKNLPKKIQLTKI